MQVHKIVLYTCWIKRLSDDYLMVSVMVIKITLLILMYFLFVHQFFWFSQLIFINVLFFPGLIVFLLSICIFTEFFLFLQSIFIFTGYLYFYGVFLFLQSICIFTQYLNFYRVLFTEFFFTGYLNFYTLFYGVVFFQWRKIEKISKQNGFSQVGHHKHGTAITLGDCHREDDEVSMYIIIHNENALSWEI